MKKIVLIPALLFIFCFILILELPAPVQKPAAPAAAAAEEPWEDIKPMIINPESELSGTEELFPVPEEEKPVPLLTSLPLSPYDENFLEACFYAASDDSPPNRELQEYLPSQTEIKGRSLILTAEEKGSDYISGKAESIFGFRYGSLSFRINTIDNPGLFPAVWMLPAQNGMLPELDIYELIGREPENFYGVIHFEDPETLERDKHFFKFNFTNPTLPDEYIVGFEWTPDALIWKLNGQIINSITEDVPQIPMYLIFNLAVGGIWCGPPTEESVFPARCEIEITEFFPQEVYTR